MAKGTCKVRTCSEPVRCRGWCNTHYMRWYRGEPITAPIKSPGRPIAERFWEKVDKTSSPDSCWLWTGYVDPNSGYGRFKGPTRKLVLAHRWAWESVHGPVPDGLEVDHVCHNRDKACPGNQCVHRRCVRPSHLRAVTHAVNAASGLVGRQWTHCKRGHLFDEANTYLRPRTGQQSCRTCGRDYARAWQRRNRKKKAQLAQSE